MRRLPDIAPVLALAVLVAAVLMPLSLVLSALCVIALVGAVLSAVHHAEVVAHRVGEPFGTLVLAVAITVIEVALIISLMLAGGPGKAALPRDTIYAAVMIICNGVVGVCLLGHEEEAHHTPGNKEQKFVYCFCRKQGS